MAAGFQFKNLTIVEVQLGLFLDHDLQQQLHQINAFHRAPRIVYYKPTSEQRDTPCKCVANLGAHVGVSAAVEVAAAGLEQGTGQVDVVVLERPQQNLTSGADTACEPVGSSGWSWMDRHET